MYFLNRIIIFSVYVTLWYLITQNLSQLFCATKRKRGEVILPEYCKKKSYAVSIP